MSNEYFSDRERGPCPRTSEEIPRTTWGGLMVAIKKRIADGSFALHYPEECPDGQGTCGTDVGMLQSALQAEVPGIEWPLGDEKVPSTLDILDLLEFCHRVVAKPIQGRFHPFFGHTHLGHNIEEGQAAFRDDINRLLARGGVAFDLGADGRVTRLAPPVLHKALHSSEFNTGDADLDSLLTIAVSKYLDPKPATRREALKELWDAWERLKTLEPGRDKKVKVQALLAKAGDTQEFRDALDREALELTEIGNTFSIRHSETTQVPLTRDEQIDYLFHRLFALIRLLLKATGRGG